MKTSLTFGTIYVPEYVVSYVEKTYHTNEMNNSQKNKRFELDKTKSNHISQDFSFQEVLEKKINSMPKK